MAYLLCWMVHFWIQLSTVTRTLSYRWQQTKCWYCCLKKAGYAEQTGQQLKYHLANYGLGPNHPQYKRNLAPINNFSVLVPATSTLGYTLALTTFTGVSEVRLIPSTLVARLVRVSPSSLLPPYMSPTHFFHPPAFQNHWVWALHIHRRETQRPLDYIMLGKSLYLLKLSQFRL